MIPEATETAALRDRIADLEQQLKLSDEGADRLAQRCLELEQHVLAVDPKQELHTGSPLLLPQLFYDTGIGFSAQDSITAPATCCNEITHEVMASFELPTDAVALRFDPGELPCCVTNLTLSDERLTCRPTNGISLAADRALFVRNDPNFLLEGLTKYPAGSKLVITYYYYPLEQLAHEPLFNAVLDSVKQTQQHNDEELAALTQSLQQSQQQAEDLQQQLAAQQQHSAVLQQQLTELTLRQQDYETSLEGVLSSSSWKLTAPLRFLVGLFHRG